MVKLPQFQCVESQTTQNTYNANTGQPLIQIKERH